MSVTRRRFVDYVAAVLWAAAGLAVTALLVKPLDGPFFMFQFAAIVGAALFGGLGPGLLATLVSCLGFFASFFPPAFRSPEGYRFSSLVLVSLVFVWLASRLRTAKAVETSARLRLAVEKAEAQTAQAKAEAAESEAKLVGAQQERLVAVVSHDLRSPINAIIMTAERLQRTGDASERQVKGMSLIVTSARRMQSLIADLLDYARARHGTGLPVKPQPVRLGDVCRAALAELRSAQPNRTVLLDVTGEDTTSLDAARVEQLVSNLITNALKHGATDAPVKVKVSGDTAEIRLEVVNQGPPIPPQLLPTLFDPFQPGDAARSLGLGLFIVREIARAHSGRVSVNSCEHETTFTVVFPRSSR